MDDIRRLQRFVEERLGKKVAIKWTPPDCYEAPSVSEDWDLLVIRRSTGKFNSSYEYYITSEDSVCVSVKFLAGVGDIVEVGLNFKGEVLPEESERIASLLYLGLSNVVDAQIYYVSLKNILFRFENRSRLFDNYRVWKTFLI